VIVLELERRPVLYSTAQHEGDQLRLSSWLESHEEYLTLLASARELAEEAA